MKRKVMKIILSILLAVAILAGGWFYFWERWFIEQVDLMANYGGAARATAVQIAFGEDDQLASYGQLSHLLTEEVRQACVESSLGRKRNENRGYKKPYELKQPKDPLCFIALPTGYEAYKRHCNDLFLERCNVITLNEIVLQHPTIHDAVMRVIDDPCQFYPPLEVMKTKLEHLRNLPTLDEDGKYIGNFNFLDISNQITDMKYAGCTDDTQYRSKLIIAVNGEENVTIKYINQ